MNPTDYFMSVLKEKGDDLVLTWEKQASASWCQLCGATRPGRVLAVRGD